ncbi:MAG: hypothetical protein MI745_09675 [Pseudomonadales bacterium]|nr:hypothetical protein [Pseudomonadales bacterium]
MTIHIHPTAANPADLHRLQVRTGMVAVISGKRADLVSAGEFANRRTPRPTPSHQVNLDHWPDGDGPSAA